MNVCLIDVIGDGVIKTFIHKGIVTGVSFLESVSYIYNCKIIFMLIFYKRLWMNFLYLAV
jgi:hypothetical protein